MSIPFPSSFLGWNSDPEIAEVAEHLYGNINNPELGLQAGETKAVVDAAAPPVAALVRSGLLFTLGAHFLPHRVHWHHQQRCYP